MLGIVIQTLTSIVDLLIKGRTDRKMKLEIDKLERERNREAKLAKSLIILPTFDDIKNYDPKHEDIKRHIDMMRAQMKDRFAETLERGVGTDRAGIIFFVIIVVILLLVRNRRSDYQE